MKKTLPALALLALFACALTGCGMGEQEAPKPDPSAFTPKAGGPDAKGNAPTPPSNP